jgi:hypothetical protein
MRFDNLRERFTTVPEPANNVEKYKVNPLGIGSGPLTGQAGEPLLEALAGGRGADCP